MKKKKIFNKTIVTVVLILSIGLTGCSLKEKVSSSMEKIENQKSHKETEGEDTKNKEKKTVDVSDDLKKGINGQTFRKLQQLEKLAVEYKEKESYTEDSAALLVMKYLRSANVNYTTLEWNMLAGIPDDGFASYVENKADKDLLSFREDAKIIDPATGDEIEFSHLVASVNLAVTQKEMRETEEGEIIPYVDYGSWGGDIIQLCAEIKGEKIDSVDWLDEMKKRIGSKHSSFNKDDLYADLDACNLEAVFEPQRGIAKAFYEYYYEVLEKSPMTRYQYFYENHFSGVRDRQALSNALSDIVLDEESVIMQTLLSMEGLDMEKDARLISTACEAFAQKIIK